MLRFFLTGMIIWLLRASLVYRPLQTIKLNSEWMLLAWVLPKLFTRQIPLTNIHFTFDQDSLGLIPSFSLLTAFNCQNRNQQVIGLY